MPGLAKGIAPWSICTEWELATISKALATSLARGWDGGPPTKVQGRVRFPKHFLGLGSRLVVPKRGSECMLCINASRKREGGDQCAASRRKGAVRETLGGWRGMEGSRRAQWWRAISKRRLEIKGGGAERHWQDACGGRRVRGTERGLRSLVER